MQVLSSNQAQHTLGYHIIWCPKYRHHVIDGAVEIELKHILTEVCMTYDWKLHALEIMRFCTYIFLFRQTIRLHQLKLPRR